MRTSRSAYIAFDVFPRAKGSSSHIASMITALAGEFAPLTLLCLGAPGLPLYQEEGPIEIFRLPPVHKDVLRRASAFARFAGEMIRQRAGTLERIVFRDPWGGVPALRAAPRVPAIFEVNALPSWELAYSRPGFAASPELQAKLGDMERYCLRHAARILCVSDVTRRALGVANAEVIPNGASDVFFSAAGEPEPAACGYVGGLQRWQGVEFFLSAFARAEVPEARALIVHSGNRDVRFVERAVARLRLHDRVAFRQALSPSELAAAMRTLRFTVAPLRETARNTVQGCCPVKIVESMAAGVPVLASDLAVTRELIRHGVDGWLEPPDDTRAWALRIRSLFAGARLPADVRESARSRFSWPAIHPRLAECFRSVTL